MTLLRTTLFLKRLMVTQQEWVAYDEHFHQGVNIIRGERNSVGKSTIANLIFYALGGEGVRWVDEALLCDWVIAEVELNGTTITLRRPISTEQVRPMRIFWGRLDDSLKAPPTDWAEYQFAQRGKDGFSQVLFRLLDIPVFRGELGSTLTMHQFLRLVFVDQRSPQDTIFRAERFDSSARREMIGEILCGFFNPEIYEKEELLRLAKIEIQELTAEIKSLRSILVETEQYATVAAVEKRIVQVQKQRAETEDKLTKIRSGLLTPTKIDRIKDDLRKKIEVLLLEAKQDLLALRRERETVALDIEDSKLFLDALRRKAESLQDSTTVANELGHIVFTVCPSCFAELSSTNDVTCRLCKRELSKEHTESQIVRARQELAQQLRESRELQAMRERRLANLDAELPTRAANVDDLNRQYSEQSTIVTTADDEVASGLTRQIGYLSRELESLQEKLRIINLLVTREEQLRTRQSAALALESEIKTMRDVQTTRKVEASTEIESRAKDLLRNDIGDEEAFRNPVEVRFDFGADSIHVNNRRNFSDSSLVYLKNSFHLAIFFASLALDFMRYPRFVLFDNIEDKGMVPARSQNFQRLIAKRSSEATQPHQIILTTSMVDAGLNDSDLTVGEYYTRDNKSLKVHRPTAEIPT